MDKTKVKAVLDLTNGSVTSESSTETGIIDRKNFTRILKDKVNSGLATPRLLIAINQYELMVYLEESFEQDSPEWNNATTKKIEIEYALFQAIVSGYDQTIYHLGLDGAGEVLDLESAKL